MSPLAPPAATATRSLKNQESAAAAAFAIKCKQDRGGGGSFDSYLVPCLSFFLVLSLVGRRGRVRIKYSNLKKHTLPVDIVSCPWSHVNGIPSYDEGCTTFGERSEPVTNYAELRSCMQESPCKITGTAPVGRSMAEMRSREC